MDDLPLTIPKKVVRNHLNTVLDEQESIHSAVKIQSLVRGWLVRQQMITSKNMLSRVSFSAHRTGQPVRPVMGSLKHTKIIFCDLVKTERQYIQDLKSLINVRCASLSLLSPPNGGVDVLVALPSKVFDLRRSS